MYNPFAWIRLLLYSFQNIAATIQIFSASFLTFPYQLAISVSRFISTDSNHLCTDLWQHVQPIGQPCQQCLARLVLLPSPLYSCITCKSLHFLSRPLSFPAQCDILKLSSDNTSNYRVTGVDGTVAHRNTMSKRDQSLTIKIHKNRIVCQL